MCMFLEFVISTSSLESSPAIPRFLSLTELWASFIHSALEFAMLCWLSPSAVIQKLPLRQKARANTVFTSCALVSQGSHSWANYCLQSAISYSLPSFLVVRGARVSWQIVILTCYSRSSRWSFKIKERAILKLRKVPLGILVLWLAVIIIKINNFSLPQFSQL
jgi:hypothetical protein